METHLNELKLERKYSCEICGHVSKREVNLQSHINIVHNKSPLRCNLCERMFLDETYLKKHQTEAHLVDLYKGPSSPSEAPGIITHTNQTQEISTVESINRNSHSKKRRIIEDEGDTETIGTDQSGGLVKKIRLMGRSFSESQSLVRSILDSLIYTL